MSTRPALALVLALAATFAACGDSKPADPLVQGKKLFSSTGCAACHRPNADGSPMAPPLRNLAQHWTREKIALYITEPEVFAAKDERLHALSKQFMAPMKAVPATEVDRLLIADWLLTL